MHSNAENNVCGLTKAIVGTLFLTFQFVYGSKTNGRCKQRQIFQFLDDSTIFLGLECANDRGSWGGTQQGRWGIGENRAAAILPGTEYCFVSRGLTGMHWARGSLRTGKQCAVICAILMLAGPTACDRGAVKPVSDAQDRLSKLMNLYRFYSDKNQKPPTNEEALREFGQKLSPQERADHLIGDDLDGIFLSPRDNQKFVVKYNLRPDPATNRALAWEATGKNGMHFVALTMGYVVEYNEESLSQYKK
jgi:hypothetical protein